MKDLLRYSRRPDIVFYQSGRIQISTKVAKQIELNSGDVIGFCNDNGEYYLYRRAKNPPGSHKCRVIRANVRTGSFIAHSHEITNIFFSICSGKTKLAIPCGEPIQTEKGITIPIITKLAL